MAVHNLEKVGVILRLALDLADLEGHDVLLVLVRPDGAHHLDGVTLGVLGLVGSLLQPLDHLDFPAVILNLQSVKKLYPDGSFSSGTYPVSCLGCCLFAAHDLPDHDHHADFGALHGEALLRGIQNLANLDGDKVLFLLGLAFCPRATAARMLNLIY